MHFTFALQGFLFNKISLPSPKKSPKKVGAPRKSYEDKKPDSQTREAGKILEDWPPAAIFRAATLAAHRAGMKNAEFIYRELEKDTEETAKELREAKKFSKDHKSMISISSRIYFIHGFETSVETVSAETKIKCFS